MIITNHDLKQKLAEVNRNSRYMQAATNTKNSVLSEEGTVFLTVEKIVKINGSKLITESGKTAELYSIPGIYWKCTVKPDSKGDMVLKQPLNALILADGSNNYCLGTNGSTSEFEIRLHIDKNEIRLNNSFLNINATHLIKNGLEVK